MNIDWKKIKKECPKSFEKLFKTYGTLIREACYCEIEKFFDGNGIIILKNFLYSYNIIKYYYEIWPKQRNKFESVSTRYLKSFDAAQIKAIYKAFEIMEGMQ